MGFGGGWVIGAYLLFWVIVVGASAFVLYLAIRKGVAHGIRDAQRLAAKEGLPSASTPTDHGVRAHSDRAGVLRRPGCRKSPAWGSGSGGRRLGTRPAVPGDFLI